MASAIRLDKNKTHSIVTPPEGGAHFYQDGFYFTHEGGLVEDMLDEAATKKLAKREARAAADARKDELYRQELANQGLNEKEVDEAMQEAKAEDATVEADPKAIDLIAWAKGQKKYVWFQVVKAFADQFSVNVSDKRNALEWLADEGKIAEDEIAI